MKKVCIILGFACVFAGCTKEKFQADEQVATKQAIIQFMGNPAADGLGWVLRLNDQTFEIPGNLPEQYKITALKVKVAFRKSSRIFPCRCTESKYMVEIISIERMS